MKNSHKLQTGVKCSKQTGAALLIGMVVLASVFAFYLMGQFGAASQKQVRQDNRIASLAEAKNALIAHAVSYIDNFYTSGDPHYGEMGFLPCPESNVGLGEGIQGGTCNNANENAIGRFPWRSLDMAPQFDESNECIWYAVSGNYKANPKTQMLNEDSNGMFEIYNAQDTRIYGNNPEDRVVAVLIAPNVPVQGQDRTTIPGTERCGGNYVVSNYLEDNGGGYNNNTLNGAPDTLDKFIKAGTNSNVSATPFNDMVLTITRDEIWNAVKRRHDFTDKMRNLTEEIATCIKGYGDAGTARNLPWPALVNLGGADYRQDANYTDVNAGAGSILGRLPNQIDASEAQLATNPPNNGNNGNGNNGNNGNGNNGNNGNGNGNNGNNGNGNGNNGGAPTSPPTGDPECTGCWNDYLAAIAVADSEYITCIDNNNPPGQCKNARNDKYDDAVVDYNSCISNFSCTPGTGTGGSTEKNEEFVLFDPADTNNAANPLNCLTNHSLGLWQHWKDHFFYVVSADFSPESVNVTCNGNCVTTTNGIEHAAIVMFSGSRTPGLTRNSPVVAGDPDEKSVIANYLSAENDGTNSIYDHVPGVAVSPAVDADILVCIDEGANIGDPLSVNPNCN